MGDRFVLELWLNTGSHNDVVAHQSYLTFTKDLLDHARDPDLDGDRAPARRHAHVHAAVGYGDIQRPVVIEVC